MKAKLGKAALGALLMGSGCALEYEDEPGAASQGQPVVHGHRAENDQYLNLVRTTNPEGGCTGLLLRNDVVLVARHCVVVGGINRGDLTGEEYDVAALSVYGRFTPSAFFVDPDVRRVTKMETDGWSQSAVLWLEQPFEVNGKTWGHFTSVFPYDEEYLTWWGGMPEVRIAGFGRSVIGEGSKSGSGQDFDTPLRVGTAHLVGSPTCDWPGMPPWDFLNVSGAWSKQVNHSGDSGSPFWADQFPGIAIGILQMRDTLDDHLGPNGELPHIGCYQRPSDYRVFVRDAIASNTASVIDGFDYPWYILFPVDYYWEQLTPSGSPGTTWTHPNGTLQQTEAGFVLGEKNAGFMVVRKRTVLQDLAMQVEITGESRGRSGVVMRYQTPDRYLVLALDDAKHEVTLRRFYDGTETLLGTAPATFDIESGATLTAYSWGPYLYAVVDGDYVGYAMDTDLVEGRIGLYSLGNQHKFDHFIAQPLATGPEEFAWDLPTWWKP